MPSEHTLLQAEQVLLLLVAVVVIERLALRIRAPVEISLLVAGLMWGAAAHFVPTLPPIAVSPDTVFVAFLPPLLVAAAYATPLDFFRRKLLPVAAVAVARVLATALLVASVVHALMPGLPFSVALLLGAIVGPVDTVTASSVAARVGLPNRLLAVLEGEGLVNDATALTLYRVTLAAIVSGSFSAHMALQQFVRVLVVGIAVGYPISWLFTRVLRDVEEPVIEIVITLLLPYVAYVAAEQLGGSGVLSAVSAGFFLRERVTQVRKPSTGVGSRSVWALLVFMVHGVLFVLVGHALSLAITRVVPWQLLTVGLCATLAILSLRLASMLLVPPSLTALQGGRQPEISRARQLVVLGWTGMRGGVSLAAALAVPYQTASGAPFPEREVLVSITFVVIFATRLIEGLSLPWLSRVLKVADPQARTHEEERARRVAAEAAMDCLSHLAAREKLPQAQVDELHRRYRQRAGQSLSRERHENQALARVEEITAEAERDAIERLRAVGDISDETAQRIEREIDQRLVWRGVDSRA